MARQWWPDTFDLPAFRVQREAYGLASGGDYVRGSAVVTLEHTALRYPTSSIDLSAIAIADRGQVFVKAFDYNTVVMEWSWPKALEEIFVEVAVVRSTYGAPSSPMQGQTIFRALQTDLPYYEDADFVVHLNPPPIIYDQPLPGGHWYYYTVFFRTNQFDWTAVMSDSTLLPLNWNHSEHLWDAIPPYYQFTDDNYRGDNGFLRQFLTIFGFEMDRTREYVESLLKLHWIDQAPMALLKGLGANYGQPYEQGLGDVRYRALLANLAHLLSLRGTAKGLLELTETVSKYDCDLTYGTNTVLLPDDSNFVNSVGHWAPIHPDVPFTGAPLETDYLSYDKVTLTAPTTMVGAPPVAGSTSCMLVDTPDANTGDIFIGIGCGQRSATDELVPYYAGLPVNPGEVYGFSAQVKCAKSVTVSAYMLVADADGQPEDMIYTPQVLTPSVGTASTPTFAAAQITGDRVWVAKLRKNAVTSVGKIASKLLNTAVYAWELSVDATNGLTLTYSLTGAAAIVASVATYAQWQTIPAGTDFWIAVWFDVDAGASNKAAGALLAYDGASYATFGSMYTIAGVYTTHADNAAPIVIGNTSGGTAGLFDGRIYTVENRTGNSPTDPGATVLWRFDAAEWITGTTFTDASGKVWTLTSASAINPKTPIIPPNTPQVFNDAGAAWHEVKMTGTVPAGAAYLIPALYFDARTTGGVGGRSPAIYVAAVMVYRVLSQGQIATFAANRYLTLGVSSEMLGVPRTTPAYEGYIMGAPPRGT
jgi:hypothetical protein